MDIKKIRTAVNEMPEAERLFLGDNIRNLAQEIVIYAETDKPRKSHDALEAFRNFLSMVGLSVILFVNLFVIPPLWITNTEAATLFPESRYRDTWCAKMNGVTEYRLDDGTRVDCMTGDYAVEVDFAPKFYEAIGQSIFYALKTGKQAGIVIIIENGTDGKYMDRLYWVTKAERIRVWTITPADLHSAVIVLHRSKPKQKGG